MNALILATIVLAQSASDGNDDFKEGYRRGFADGFAQGQQAGGAPPPPKPGPTGPITISNAYYGTSSKNCNATRWLARQVNGRRSASVEVSNAICGDPAPGGRKSLEVTYICGGFAKSASAYEHRTLYLDCNT